MIKEGLKPCLECVFVHVCLSQREKKRERVKGGDMVVKMDCGLQHQCLEVFGLILTLDNSKRTVT